MKNKIYHGPDHVTRTYWTKEEYKALLKWAARYGYGPQAGTNLLGIQKFIKRITLERMKKEGYIIVKEYDMHNHAPIL